MRERYARKPEWQANGGLLVVLSAKEPRNTHGRTAMVIPVIIRILFLFFIDGRSARKIGHAFKQGAARSGCRAFSCPRLPRGLTCACWRSCARTGNTSCDNGENLYVVDLATLQDDGTNEICEDAVTE